MSDDILDLLKTVPEPPMWVDPYAAMAAGRRARVRRRFVLTAAAVVSVLAVATGSVLVAGRDGALPARPAPSSPTPTSPTPSATPRSLSTQLGPPDKPLTAVLDRAVTTVDLRRSGDPLGSPSLALPVPSSAGAASCRVSPALLVQACAVRAPVRGGITTYRDPTTPDVTPGAPVVGRFSVPDVSVVVVGAPADDLPHLRGAAWELDDGTVADSSGAPVPQAHGREVPVTVFASLVDGGVVVGLRSDSLDGWMASDAADSAPGTTRTGMGDARGDYYAYVLPAAAVSGEVLPRSGRVASQEVLVLGGRKVLVAHLTGVARFSGPTAEWVDRDGGVHPVTD